MAQILLIFLTINKEANYYWWSQMHCGLPYANFGWAWPARPAHAAAPKPTWCVYWCLLRLIDYSVNASATTTELPPYKLPVRWIKDTAIVVRPACLAIYTHSFVTVSDSSRRLGSCSVAYTGWAKKVSLICFAITLPTACQFSKFLTHIHYRKLAIGKCIVCPSDTVCVTTLPCKILITTLPPTFVHVYCR